VSRPRLDLRCVSVAKLGNRYTLINCRKQFPNTSIRLLKDILCHCLRERAITGSLWEGVHALLVTLQQPELCLPLLHAMQPQDLANLTLHPEFEKIMKPRLQQVAPVVLRVLSLLNSASESSGHTLTPPLSPPPLTLALSPTQWHDSLPVPMQQLLDGVPLAAAEAAAAPAAPAQTAADGAVAMQANDSRDMEP
jgi:hypothetical protein